MPTNYQDDDDRNLLPEDPEATAYLEIEGPEGEPSTEEGDDGYLMVDLDGDDDDQENAEDDDEFYANLADGILPSLVLNKISSDLMQKIAQDKESRKDRDQQYEEGLQRTGMAKDGKEAPGGAQFEGASRVVHPMLQEACVDFNARIMKELWPPSGPVKPKMLGKATQAKEKKAKRKSSYMNWQLTLQIEEARTVMETMLTQLPLGGSQFIRTWYDHRLKRIRWQFVGIDKVYLPANAQSFGSASRRTFTDTIDQVEFQMRVQSGMYRDMKLSPSAMPPDVSRTQKANDKIEGVDQDVMNLDRDREIYETMAFLTVTPEMAAVLQYEEEDGLYPYLITIDVETKQILSVYRDWEENSDVRKPIDHLFEFGFIPWRGALAVGLPHIMGGLPGAATGALRALLDSAHVNNMQGGFILKGSGTSGQNKRPGPGEFGELEGSGAEMDDIRKKVMPFAVREPSAVLFQLLGFVVQSGQSVVRTSLDASAVDTNTNVPVGTQLSRVEEGLAVFSYIHGKVHAAFNRLLEGQHRLNRMYMPEEITFDEDGDDAFAYRQDFEGRMDTQPTSDPNIYSDQQRMGQIIGMEQSNTTAPGIYNMRAIQEWKLEIWKVPDPDRFLVPAPQPHELNAINENLAMTLGQPVTAFPDQDHLAHIQAHLDYLRSPVLGSNPLIAPTFMPAVVKHLVQHIGYHYVKTTTDLIRNTSGADAHELMTDDTPTKAMLDKLLAAASTHVVPEVEANFQAAMPILQQAAQTAQQYQPKPPMDPALAAVQAAQAETQRKTSADQTNAQLKGADSQSKAQTDAQRNAIDASRVQADRDNAELEADTKIRTTAMDNATAERISQERALLGGKSQFTTGGSMSHH